MNFRDYELGGFFDEMFCEDGQPRSAARHLARNMESLPDGELLNRQLAADRALIQAGITFNVYGESAGVEKTLPFDLVPRIVPAAEWERIERGLKQRIKALNLFIGRYLSRPVQNHQATASFLREIIYSCQILPRNNAFAGIRPRGIWCHITGTDLVRHRDGQIYVLEDNLRCPSGVSYVLENRRLMKSLFPEVFCYASQIRPVANYPFRLRDIARVYGARAMACLDPRVVLLTPGIYNSAYFEHSFLAQQMGSNSLKAAISWCRV